jgi:uncharacterized membrane protein YeaQ/YmgE (transglycosylase-associated protein family)
MIIGDQREHQPVLEDAVAAEHAPGAHAAEGRQALHHEVHELAMLARHRRPSPRIRFHHPASMGRKDLSRLRKPICRETAMSSKETDVHIIGFLIIGLVAGWLAGNLMKGGGFGLVGNLVVGVIGALVGGFLFGLLGFETTNIIGSLITAVVGAIVLLGVVGVLKKA